MKKLRVGMIGGGGEKNFFGNVHKKAIYLDGTREIVAGALRSDKKASLESAEKWGIKGYEDYRSFVRACSKKEINIDYVTITTPNNVHFAPAKAFLELGIPVLCEKPMTLNVQEAKILADIVKKKKIPFVLAHTYTGHPMVMLAREMVRNGDIGEVRKAEGWYYQGWLASKAENQSGAQQAQWRVDPKKAGISCCGGDIGTHAHMAVRWVTGLEVKKVSARLNTFVKGRLLDDDFNVIAVLENGATALITATQIAVGHKNDHGFRIIGSKGTIEWHQEQAEKLQVNTGSYDKIYWLGAGFDYFPSSIKPYLRLPAGHNEDFLEALANLHLTMEFYIRRKKGEPNMPKPYPHPSAFDGLQGMAFVKASVDSSKKNGKWTKVIS